MTETSRKGVLSALGPGLLFAAAAVGVSHLVQSTRAGAVYGLALVGMVILANVVKYPAFRFGPYYSVATRTSILEGYRRQGTWALVLYGLLTLGTMFTVLGAIAPLWDLADDRVEQRSDECRPARDHDHVHEGIQEEQDDPHGPEGDGRGCPPRPQRQTESEQCDDLGCVVEDHEKTQVIRSHAGAGRRQGQCEARDKDTGHQHQNSRLPSCRRTLGITQDAPGRNRRDHKARDRSQNHGHRG